MSKIGIFMADGCEEIEGLTVVDVVRRAKMEIVMLSITGKKEVTSSHGVTFLADALAEETDMKTWMESCFRAVCREPCIYWKMRPSMP